MNPTILAIYVMVAVMLVISGVSERACGFLLKGLSLVAKLCLSQTGLLIDEAQRLLPEIGTNLWHVIKTLKLTPNACSYVCCPKCFACYLQTSNDAYLDKCIYKKTLSGTELLKIVLQRALMSQRIKGDCRGAIKTKVKTHSSAANINLTKL